MRNALGTVMLLLGAAACGRTVPSSTDLIALTVSDAGPQCVENGDCGQQEVCLENACVFFGECLKDFHCGTVGGCVENECKGELIEYPPGEPELCEINADCSERTYCVGGECRLGVECLGHTHCDVGKACVRQLCLDAI